MKVVPLSSFKEACNKAMHIENEKKTSREKNESDDYSEGGRSYGVLSAKVKFPLGPTVPRNPLGHSIKQCPYNLKVRSTQVLFTQGEQVTLLTTLPKPINFNALLGGYSNKQRGGNNNSHNTPRRCISYNVKG